MPREQEARKSPQPPPAQGPGLETAPVMSPDPTEKLKFSEWDAQQVKSSRRREMQFGIRDGRIY